MFWTGTKLSGCFDVMTVRGCLPAKDVHAFVLMECNSMHKMPCNAQGCCFVCYHNGNWNFGVIEKLTKEELHYRSFTEGSLHLQEDVYKIPISNFKEHYSFKFVNVFHRNMNIPRSLFLHHCVITVSYTHLRAHET